MRKEQNNNKLQNRFLQFKPEQYASSVTKCFV